MNSLFDALEICLQGIENGTDLETVLTQFPEYAGELRPILETAIKARSMSVPDPTPEMARRGRARVMQRAAEWRESKLAPRRREISIFPRLALSFALLLMLLMSGTGILSASASALPGENLYPVKRGWESVRLFFIFDQEARDLLANEFENERLHEVNELLAEGRHETIQFAGVFILVNGTAYVSGLPVVFPANIQVPENGAAVIVSGRTNAQGFIELTSLDLLPMGSVVPAGSPIEVESEEEALPQPGTGSSSGSEAVATAPVYFEFQGMLQSISTNTLIVNDMTVYLANAPVNNGRLCIGMNVEVKGYYAEDGRFIVTEIEGKGSCSDGSSGGGSSGSNSNSGSDSNENNAQGDGESNENGDSGNKDNDNNDDDNDKSDNGDDDHGGNEDDSGSDDNDSGGDDNDDD